MEHKLAKVGAAEATSSNDADLKTTEEDDKALATSSSLPGNKLTPMKMSSPWPPSSVARRELRPSLEMSKPKRKQPKSKIDKKAVDAFKKARKDREKAEKEEEDERKKARLRRGEQRRRSAA